MSQRVTLDHPELENRTRRTITSTAQSSRPKNTRVDSFILNRANQARQHATRTTYAKPEVNPHVDVMDKAARVAQARVKNLEHTRVYSDYYNERQQVTAVSKWKFNSVYAMASFLFIIGMFVAISGFVSTTKANQQIETIDQVLGSGNKVAVERLASSVPNEDDVTEADVGAYQVGADEPRYIRIPSIGIGTTRVLNLGLTEGNAVDTPESIYDTGWYNRSAKLTDELGAMFIVGHYVGPNQAGVFFNLEDVKPGNIVEIEHGDGNFSYFRIVEKMEFPVNDVNMDLALNPVNPDKLGLNLMTCSGEWDVSSQQYDHRTLVRTEKI